jgi:hypothetical protein
MNCAVKRMTAVLACGAMVFLAATAAVADEWPLASGDYWEVSGIKVKDGGDFKYAQWLATEWRKNMEFAKSKGWIKDAKILYNQYPRQGEADIYLVTIRDSIPTGPQSDKRGQEWQEWMKKTFESMVGESGNRAEYRTVLGSELLQEAIPRK